MWNRSDINSLGDEKDNSSDEELHDDNKSDKPSSNGESSTGKLNEVS